MLAANVLEKLNKVGREGIKDLVLYGRVETFIETPGFLTNIKTDGKGDYALLRVYFLRCLGVDEFSQKGMISQSKQYLTNGTAIICLSDPEMVGKWVAVYGRKKSYGVKLRQQYGHKKFNDGVCAFPWSKGDHGEWLASPNVVRDLDSRDVDLDLIEITSRELLKKSFANNTSIKDDDLPEVALVPAAFEGCDGYVGKEAGSVNIVKSVYHESNNERFDITKIDLKLTKHMSGIEIPEKYYSFEKSANYLARSRKDYAKFLSEYIKDRSDIYGTTAMEAAKAIRQAFVYRIASRLTVNIGDSKIKGRYYVDRLLECLKTSKIASDDKYSDKAIEAYRDSVIENPTVLMSNSGGFAHFSNDVDFSICVIAVGSGIGYDDLCKNFKSMEKVVGVDLRSWFVMLLANPYLISFMGSNLSVQDADAVYFGFSRYFCGEKGVDDSCFDIRNDLLLLKSVEKLSLDRGDSYVKKFDLQGYQRQYKYPGAYAIQNHGFILKKDQTEMLKVLTGVSGNMLSSADRVLLLDGKFYSPERVEQNVESGVLYDNGDSVILAKDLEKELLIFKVFQEMGTELTGITDDQCQAAISDYEKWSGFSLEPLQKEGVHLTKYRAAVLSGCAGSGKTTTSEVMKMCLMTCMEGYKMIYCAPTGKAARRLAEVVRGTVKTIHSQFRVGVGVGESFLSMVGAKVGGVSKKDEEDEVRGHIYLIDEAGMLSRDLLYEVARNIKDGDLCYFLGDIKQLPPIGVGVPFYVLMQILPCVELGVSKRAAEGSLINYNTTLINCMSDGIVEGLVFDDTTFMKIDCTDAEIPYKVKGIWQKFMDGKVDGVSYPEKDLQVISGYSDERKSFSSTTLNRPLQEYLRRNDKFLFKHGDKGFYKNDRVIHVNKNNYGTQRFVEVEKGVYQEVATVGLINGEMGTLLNIYDSQAVTFLDFNEDEAVAGEGVYSEVTEDELDAILETREAYEDKIIKMRDQIGEDIWVVTVKVYDVDLRKDVLVFYWGRKSYQDNVFVLSGDMLGNLDLAYALTCHKMQGSQTPIAIIPLGSSCSPRFINRNMLNTMITRSQKIVVLVGTISGEESPLNEGRKVVSDFNKKSPLNDLTENVIRR